MDIQPKRAINRSRWQSRVADWKASGLSQKAFCEQHHLGLAAFRRWCGIFKAEQTESSEESNRPAFVPVSVQAPVAPPLAVRLNDEFRIEVPPDFDPMALQRLIQVLRAA